MEGNFCFDLVVRNIDISCYPLLEGLALCKGERIGLGNDWNDINDVRQLFKDDNVNGFEPTSANHDLGSTHGQRVE